MHRRVAAALAAALALAVASCGESESLTRAQVVNRIEAACRQAAEGSSEGARGESAENFFAAVLVGQRQLVEKVEGLEAPDELDTDVETVKNGLAERADIVADLAATPRSQQERAIAAANERLEAVTRDLEAAFRRLGVRGCT